MHKKTGLICKCYETLGNNDAVLKSFYAFILPCFEYCSPVRCSASDSHLKLLDRAPSNIRFFLPVISIDLEKCRNIACLSMPYKILHNVNHPLHCKLPQFFFSRWFTYSTTCLWNNLPNEVVLTIKHDRFVPLDKKSV